MMRSEDPQVGLILVSLELPAEIVQQLSARLAEPLADQFGDLEQDLDSQARNFQREIAKTLARQDKQRGGLVCNYGGGPGPSIDQRHLADDSARAGRAYLFGTRASSLFQDTHPAID